MLATSSRMPATPVEGSLYSCVLPGDYGGPGLMPDRVASAPSHLCLEGRFELPVAEIRSRRSSEQSYREFQRPDARVLQTQHAAANVRSGCKAAVPRG